MQKATPIVQPAVSCSSKYADSVSRAFGEIADRKKYIEDLLGGTDWRFYIYDDEPFRALTTDLDLPPTPVSFGNEGIACVWTHRGELTEPSSLSGAHF